MTVGSGVAPDLLTLPLEGARGLMIAIIHRRWGLSPRPENGLTMPSRAAGSKAAVDLLNSEKAVGVDVDLHAHAGFGR